MNRHRLAWQSSITLHLLMIGIFLLANSDMSGRSRPIKIDFTYDIISRSASPAAASVATSAPTAVKKVQNANPQPAPAAAKQQTLPAPITPSPPLPAVSMSMNKQELQRVAVESMEWGETKDVPMAEVTEPTGGGGGDGETNSNRPVLTGDGTKSGGDPQQVYLREHFIFIRTLIMKELGYPALARRMGWSGEVKVSFMIQEDGTVKGLKVVKSSGRAILDENVLATIYRVAPFPHPPVAAEIVMPIVYQLN